jgi:hypothetical protein
MNPGRFTLECVSGVRVVGAGSRQASSRSLAAGLGTRRVNNRPGRRLIQPQTPLGAAVGAVYGSHDRRVAVKRRQPGGRRGLAAWEWLVMSAVTEHLEQRGSTFELLPHRQASTSTDEARALGIDAGEVLKTLTVRTGVGYVPVVIPASCRLDLHLSVTR